MSAIVGLWSNKTIRNIFLAILAIVAIVLLYNWITDKYYDAGFKAGESTATEKFLSQQNKLKSELQAAQESADADRKALNDKLAEDREKAQEELATQQAKNKDLQERLNVYKNSKSASGQCFAPNNTGLQLIKDSIPANRR